MTFANRTRTRAFWTAIFIIIVFVATPQAQVSPVSYNGPTVAPSTAAPDAIELLVGRSTVLNVGSPIARVSLTMPDIADALVTAPQQLLIHGKTPGTISLFVWDRSGAIRTYEVTVRRDLGVLANQLRQLFPGEPVTVTGSGKDVVLSGRVSTPYVVDKAAEVAIAYAEKKENVVNLLKLQEGVPSNQVMLKVRFAEVSRSAVQDLGVSWFTGPGGYRDYVARMTTQQFAAPNFEEMDRISRQGEDHWGGGRDTVEATGGKMTFSDFLNIFLFNNRYNVGSLIKAMSSKGLFQSLAEPNLVATDGKEASFLAGGEYPYPVVQGTAQGTSLTIQFKEFGIRLSFTPTILGGDVIHLKLRPEVSSLDFNNAVIIEGFRIPALTTRRTETEIELRDGQTFAIAGLLNNTAVSSMRKVPGIGDIPILGLLFKSRAYTKETTELVVMITPQILRRDSTGASSGLPNLVEPYLGAPGKSIPPPPPYTGSPRYGASQPGPEASIQPPQQPAPAPAPAAPARQQAAPPRTVSPPAVQPQAVQPQAVQPSVTAPPPAPPTLSKAEQKRIDEARKREEEQRRIEAKRQEEAQKAAAKAAAEDQKRQEVEAKAALKKAEEDKQRLEEAAREQAKRDAAAAKKAAEDKRKAEEQQKKLAAEEAKRQKELADAEKKLKDAQRAYEAVVRTTPPKPIP
ncbi:MAG TPA: pilus assembly protein N-terminal domain-containing protein [Vicinamibacterales bacterium]|nr:pilus assembly protein N-terminal domain-containing protein [Vicinamibacterales bacterium]